MLLVGACQYYCQVAGFGVSDESSSVQHIAVKLQTRHPGPKLGQCTREDIIIGLAYQHRDVTTTADAGMIPTHPSI